jgi:hypothetical protein
MTMVRYPRFFQYYVAACLIVSLVLAFTESRYRARRQAVDAIRRHGGDIVVGSAGNWVVLGDERSVLWWHAPTTVYLGRRCPFRGGPCFNSVWIRQEDELSDEALSALCSLSSLRQLDLSGLRIDDAQVSRLCELRQLRVIYLDDSLVTDAGIQNLATLPQLQRVNLKGTSVSEAVVSRLATEKPYLVIEL